MTTSSLDYMFPFIVFAYGFLLLFSIELPALIPGLKEKTMYAMQHLEPKRRWAWLCLIVGSIWSLQNILLA